MVETYTMDSLRVSEHYISIQGEGPLTGKPTQFLRFAGCNMRCPGWPCDTQHAIQPSIWLKESTKEPWQDIADRIEFLGFRAPHVCITGGEPFIQDSVQLERLTNWIEQNHMTWEVFTNGSIEFPPWITQAAHTMMDWKLNGSGEGQKFLDERLLNVKKLRSCGLSKYGIKFVIANRADYDQAVEVIQMLDAELGYAGLYWFGAVWDKIEQDQIVDMVQDACEMFQHRCSAQPNTVASRIRMNVQVHKFLWPGVEKGI